MIDLSIWEILSLFLSLGFPLFISIYEETRYVKRKNLLTYGVALIIFTFTFFSLPLTENHEFLRFISIIFLVLGGLMIYFWKYPNKNFISMKNSKSLIYSWKNFGAFEFAFVSAVFYSEIPKIIYFFGIKVLDLGISLLIIFWATSFGIRLYRKWTKDKKQ